MMKNKLFKLISLTLAVLMVFALSACENTPPEETPEPEGPVEYTVSVSDYNGEVPEYNVLVEFYNEAGERLSMKKINAEGKVTIELERGNYTFLVKSNETLYYDEAECTLTAEKLTAEVKLYTTPDSSHTIYPPFNDENGNETRSEAYEAKIIDVGANYVEIDRTDMAYFIFDAKEGGVYSVRVIDTSVDIGYYGNPHAVQNIKLIDSQNGGFEIPIYDSSIGGETSAMIVIGLSSETAKNAVIVVTRIGDIPPGIPDTVVSATELPSVFNKVDYLNNKLVDVDVTDRNAKVVYNESDGFYHYGTENGPIVYVRVSSASKHGIAAFSEIETRLFRAVYDDNGELIQKLVYNQLIDDYEAVCDQNGICPLTTEFMSMIKNVGEQFGWWDFENTARNIFMYDADGNLTNINDLTIVKGNEWMFPLCYVEEFVYGVETPIKVNPAADKNYSVMVREDGAVKFVSDKAATLVIKDAVGITVNYDGSAYTADENGYIRVTLKANELAFSVAGPNRATVNFTFESIAAYYTPVTGGEFSVAVKADEPAVIVLEKTATLIIDDASGVTVIYAGESYTANAQGKITVIVTADELELVIECTENKNVMFTFENVGL